jgi:hypothetical protein
MLKTEGLEAGVRGRRQGLGSCRRGPRRQRPGAVGYGAKDPAVVATGQYCRPLAAPLMSWPTAAGTPSAVGHGARCTFAENFDSIIYFSKIMTN